MSIRQCTMLVALTLACTATACDKDKAKNAAVTAKAEQVWKTRCETCHGKDGRGNGPGAAALNPKPRSFTDPKWQASVDDARIAKVIVEGGAAVGLSATMAPNPDLASDPAAVQALVKKIRKLVQ